MNNNIKLQKNLKLKEEINNLTKEKQELENKYKNLQKASEENGMKNLKMKDEYQKRKEKNWLKMKA